MNQVDYVTIFIASLVLKQIDPYSGDGLLRVKTIRPVLLIRSHVACLAIIDSVEIHERFCEPEISGNVHPFPVKTLLTGFRGDAGNSLRDRDAGSFEFFFISARSFYSD